ncbi:BTB/POZ protein [Gaertneriomyces semiglobifer]|nr:BTB/POZ protein [Gaertneriomyces semiglobifer]
MDIQELIRANPALFVKLKEDLERRTGVKVTIPTSLELPPSSIPPPSTQQNSTTPSRPTIPQPLLPQSKPPDSRMSTAKRLCVDIAQMPEIVKLQVGEQRFTTTKDTLRSRSAYFDALFSGRFREPDLLDGHIFVDRNGDLFHYILEYFRTGDVPVLYDAVKGFDHLTYKRLLAEARFFQIRDLEDIILSKAYTKEVLVKRRYVNRLWEDMGSDPDIVNVMPLSDTKGIVTSVSYNIQ